MNEQTKLGLSPRELEIAMSAELILTKQHIIHTVNSLLNEQVVVIKKALQSKTVIWPLEVMNSAPRIYKGENYNSLPYVILDYPAVFGKENIFAVRTMFWWANFFSVTLHLKGKHQRMFATKICANIEKEIEGLFICVNQDQWEHHFEETNYVSVRKLEKEDLRQQILAGDFVKLAFKITLEDWNNTGLYLAHFYEKIANLLSD